MKIELTVKKEFDVVFLRAKVGARYWEDGEVDISGELMPCIEDGCWCPLIDIETG